ncbi:CGNR zinc finger domain-containing protein [Pseudonocardia xinjiangensis]|uniref:CGNR zinc finger domain-containing protein n=1 Tax=Pseudonocardia xinjiangensis TaxID=75289 RepID=UPI003D918E31
MGGDTGRAAPGSLELVRRFVDTQDLYNDRDEMGDATAATAWLARADVIDGTDPITRRDLADLHGMRDALREMAAANTIGDPSARAAVEAFNEISARHPASVRLDLPSGAMVAALVARRDGGPRAIATIAAAVAEAVLVGTWPRLKSCANPECRWLFYDGSRSRTARWCSMGACGSIVKSRRYRQRHREAATG